MRSTITFKIQKHFVKWRTKQASDREEGFVNSLNQVQKSYFVKIKTILSDYEQCLCYKQDSVIIIESDKMPSSVFCSIAMYASECRVLFTEMNFSSSLERSDSKIIKHSETRYFNDNAGIIFEFMLDECLKKKRRDHENKRNDLIS